MNVWTGLETRPTNPLDRMTRRILLIESLLADDEAWSDANDSMQSEAIAMLSAVAEDFRSLPETEPTVLLSPHSCKALRSTGQVVGNSRVEEAPSGPAAWLDDHANQTALFDVMMLIAPECGGNLVSLLQLIQNGPWNHVRCLNVDSRVAATFSDKRATAEWLRTYRISTPETKAISDVRAFGFLQRRTRIAEYCVLKPRDGVGSERVNVISLGRAEFATLREDSHEADTGWVLQPLIPGDACSIGLIGGGADRPTMILPAARQDVRNEGDQFRYYGGMVPCEAPLASAVRNIAEQVAAALGAFSGYLGIDLVVSTAGNGTTTATVIEINPRLCTSYIGYRALCEDNLAACLLQLPGGESVRWKTGAITFNTEGQVRST